MNALKIASGTYQMDSFNSDFDCPLILLVLSCRGSFFNSGIIGLYLSVHKHQFRYNLKAFCMVSGLDVKSAFFAKKYSKSQIITRLFRMYDQLNAKIKIK